MRNTNFWNRETTFHEAQSNPNKIRAKSAQVHVKNAYYKFLDPIQNLVSARSALPVAAYLEALLYIHQIKTTKSWAHCTGPDMLVRVLTLKNHP